jgi:hypothetical protein
MLASMAATTAAADEGLRLPSPWAAVGRDTEAGRALFALYNGFGQARNQGNKYSSQNRLKIMHQLAMNGPQLPLLPKPPPPKKPVVKVPQFHRKQHNFEDICPVEFMRGRRKASQILEQLREDSYVVEVPPVPQRPLLDEREKSRLQEVFEWSNRDLGPEPLQEEEPWQVIEPEKGSIQEQEMLLDTIAQEVEERKTFIKEMEQYGKGDKYRLQIHKEIEDRIKQMSMLHQSITMEEKKILEKQAKAAAAAVIKDQPEITPDLVAQPPAKESPHDQEQNSTSTQFHNHKSEHGLKMVSTAGIQSPMQETKVDHIDKLVITNSNQEDNYHKDTNIYELGGLSEKPPHRLSKPSHYKIPLSVTSHASCVSSASSIMTHASQKSMKELPPSENCSPLRVQTISAKQQGVPLSPISNLYSLSPTSNQHFLSASPLFPNTPEHHKSYIM